MYHSLLGFSGFIYWLLRNKEQFKWLTIFHVVSIIFIPIILLIIAAVSHHLVRSGNLDSFNFVMTASAYLMLFVTFSQIIFILNIAICLIRNQPKKNTL